MPLNFGETVPFFSCAALDGLPNYAFDAAAGRPIVLLVHGSGAWGPSAAAIDLVARHQDLFDDRRAAFFGITIDARDVGERRIRRRIPGIRWFLDYDMRVSRLLGAVSEKDGQGAFEPHWLLLDPALRVVQRAAIGDGEAIFRALRTLIDEGLPDSQAPVLVVPRIFEPELCRHLVALYNRHGGTESGFMREENGLTVGKVDHSFKRRSDYHIDDADLREALRTRLVRRLVPQIARAFSFEPTRIERWIVACYDGDTGGFFSPHRDNTTAGTAHRRFACTINLNAEEFEGGELRFPEFGARTYRAPTGGAVVFSCSLLHEATPVTRGKRYAMLPFFYDEAAAQVRAQNRAKLASNASAPASGAG
jgi:predicted 2-oxoglutarate/Fe(II)-dependent dioxygenase YbiX